MMQMATNAMRGLGWRVWKYELKDGFSCRSAVLALFAIGLAGALSPCHVAEAQEINGALATQGPSTTQAQPEQQAPSVQLAQPTNPAPPVTVTLQDALERARKNDAQYLATVGDVKSAHEDRMQARAAMLPSVSDLSGFLNTQGTGVNGVAEGRFVTNDGVHVYEQWAALHQDLSPNTYLRSGINRAAAAEAIAKAKAEIARRGLNVTVTKAYYALVVGQRKYATTQQALDQSKRFFDIAQGQERAGQVAHSDAIKAEIQYRQQEQAFDEAKLAMEDARLDLAVLLFPTLNENFSVVDDLESAQPLPAFSEVEAMAEKENPTLRVANETVRQSNLDVVAAKGAFLPSFLVDVDYGIQANHFAMNSTWATHPDAGPVPALGYFLTATMTFPVWDWGSLRSKLHQAEIKQDEAHTSLTQTQRQLLSALYSSYNEGSTARAAVESARRTSDLAAESLRLTTLRYQAGESTALEVVDAQNTLITARNSYSDVEARYRVAIATLQTITGNF
jgi:outer membrane protein TolC